MGGGCREVPPRRGTRLVPEESSRSAIRTRAGLVGRRRARWERTISRELRSPRPAVDLGQHPVPKSSCAHRTAGSASIVAPGARLVVARSRWGRLARSPGSRHHNLHLDCSRLLHRHHGDGPVVGRRTKTKALLRGRALHGTGLSSDLRRRQHRRRIHRRRVRPGIPRRAQRVGWVGSAGGLAVMPSWSDPIAARDERA